MNGWIKLYRQLQDCPIWYSERYSKGQAWVDLLLLANHSDKKILFNGDFITIKRGQYLTSMVKLSEKWKWNRKTVSSFLKLLENDNMITKVSDNTKTLITIVNYSIYQSDSESIGQHTGQPIGQLMGNLLDTNKNDKNIKNDKEREESSASPPSIVFQNRFSEFWELYPKKVNMLLASGDYIYLFQTTPSLSEEDLIVATRNYAESCRIQKAKDKFIKNPDRWIKESCWIDYLPENYKKPEVGKKENRFNQFKQNDYDFDQLEKEFLGNGGINGESEI